MSLIRWQESEFKGGIYQSTSISLSYISGRWCHMVVLERKTLMGIDLVAVEVIYAVDDGNRRQRQFIYTNILMTTHT
ncbi:hypothetical protein TorRG33x02_082460 [Trema orientale]|uniref:Uncharacterized protein n=1 Tax=Trema orientale TaxID=63057 RepID=A0A2P5FDY6_TREOI|nr:hypothetical protein TorRG33x02_082460 [Trema orientale]